MDEAEETTSFYSDGLNDIDQSVISNRQRLDNGRAPTNDRSEPKTYQPPFDHLMSEAIKKQHQRNLSKANADLAEELETLSVKVGTKEKTSASQMVPSIIQAPRVEKILQEERSVKQSNHPEENKNNQRKTRYDEIMSYLGNIEEEFS